MGEATECPVRIYMLTCRVTGKSYIGQTCSSVARRWSLHRIEARLGRTRGVLHKAIRKHGFDNFEVKEIAVCGSREEANAAETALIKRLNTLVPHGYNLAAGGAARAHHEETKRLLAALALGRRASAQTKAKMQDSQRARHARDPVSNETRQRMSAAKKGKSPSESHKTNLSVSKRNVWQNLSSEQKAARLAQLAAAREKSPIMRETAHG